MEKQLYCEKCGSDSVTETVIKPEPKKEIERVSIADYKPPSQIMPAVYHVTTIEVRCKACGNSKTVSF